MPGTRTEVWPHSGHFPHLAHPHRFAQLLAATAVGTNANLATAAR
jgi:pimeloyl-ACP methyl ester carboxylesterase